MNKLFAFILLVFFTVSCTNNPFFEDDSARDTHILRGKVLLEPGEPPTNIYVWLENLNISTTTNAEGEFRIELPRTDDLRGYNNDLRLYYYVGNYKIQYSNVLVVDGMFQFNKYDINSDGVIKETIYLKKLLDITTIIDPDEISEDFTDSLVLKVNVTNLDTNLLIVARMTHTDLISGLIFREINSPPSNAKMLDLGDVYRGYYLFTPAVWDNTFLWRANFLPPGIYEVYPHIFLRQEELPQELLDSFGTNAEQFNNAYLKIPFTHNPDTLIIR